MTQTLHNLKHELEMGKGYETFTLSKEEHALFNGMIRDCFLLRIQYEHPDLLKQFYAIDLADYHHHAHLLDHANMWQNHVRIFPSLFVQQIRQLPFFKQLQEAFGPAPLATFSLGCQEEVWYRLVRPNAEKDIGSLHADRWFWEINNVSSPSNYKRAKVWMAINMPDPAVGLHVVPNSHKRAWNYKTVRNTALKASTTQVKPLFDDSLDGYELFCPIEREGECIIFHDNLLHKGVPNTSDETRISVELTIYY